MEITWIVLLLIACLYFAVSTISQSKQTQDKITNKKSADESTAEKATVIRILPGDNSSQVLFEKENGERVNISVPQEKCTFLEGETGWLKEAANTFSSFTNLKDQQSEQNDSAEGEKACDEQNKK